MLKYRGSALIRAGFIGVVLIGLVIAVGLQPERITSWATSTRYQALFAEAGGLTAGNDVKISGVKVGAVSDVRLQKGRALVTFALNGRVHLGGQSTAHIRTGTLLGERIRIAHNGELIAERGGIVLGDGDELAFLPPVSGG